MHVNAYISKQRERELSSKKPGRVVSFRCVRIVEPSDDGNQIIMSSVLHKYFFSRLCYDVDDDDDTLMLLRFHSLIYMH